MDDYKLPPGFEGIAEQAAAAERAKVVAWLRTCLDGADGEWDGALSMAAEGIEALAHHEGGASERLGDWTVQWGEERVDPRFASINAPEGEGSC